MSPAEWTAAAAGMQAVATIALVVVTVQYVRRADRQATAAETSAQANARQARHQRSGMFGDNPLPRLTTTQCEHCRERIQIQATVCPHCHREQPEE